MHFLCFVLLLLSAIVSVRSAETEYTIKPTISGYVNWTTGENWVGDTAPVIGNNPQPYGINLRVTAVDGSPVVLYLPDLVDQEYTLELMGLKMSGDIVLHYGKNPVGAVTLVITGECQLGGGGFAGIKVVLKSGANEIGTSVIGTKDNYPQSPIVSIKLYEAHLELQKNMNWLDAGTETTVRKLLLLPLPGRSEGSKFTIMGGNRLRIQPFSQGPNYHTIGLDTEVTYAPSNKWLGIVDIQGHIDIIPGKVAGSEQPVYIRSLLYIQADSGFNNTGGQVFIGIPEFGLTLEAAVHFFYGYMYWTSENSEFILMGNYYDTKGSFHLINSIPNPKINKAKLTLESGNFTISNQLVFEDGHFRLNTKDAEFRLRKNGDFRVEEILWIAGSFSRVDGGGGTCQIIVNTLTFEGEKSTERVLLGDMRLFVTGYSSIKEFNIAGGANFVIQGNAEIKSSQNLVFDGLPFVAAWGSFRVDQEGNLTVYDTPGHLSVAHRFAKVYFANQGIVTTMSTQIQEGDTGNVLSFEAGGESRGEWNLLANVGLSTLTNRYDVKFSGGWNFYEEATFNGAGIIRFFDGEIKFQNSGTARHADLSNVYITGTNPTNGPTFTFLNEGVSISNVKVENVKFVTAPGDSNPVLSLSGASIGGGVKYSNVDVKYTGVFMADTLTKCINSTIKVFGDYNTITGDTFAMDGENSNCYFLVTGNSILNISGNGEVNFDEHVSISNDGFIAFASVNYTEQGSTVGFDSLLVNFHGPFYQSEAGSMEIVIDPKLPSNNGVKLMFLGTAEVHGRLFIRPFAPINSGSEDGYQLNTEYNFASGDLIVTNVSIIADRSMGLSEGYYTKLKKSESGMSFIVTAATLTPSNIPSSPSSPGSAITNGDNGMTAGLASFFVIAAVIAAAIIGFFAWKKREEKKKKQQELDLEAQKKAEEESSKSKKNGTFGGEKITKKKKGKRTKKIKVEKDEESSEMSHDLSKEPVPQYGAIQVSDADRPALNSTKSKSNVKQGKVDWLIDFSELKFEKELGQGAYGSVWKGKMLDTPCAIKQNLLVAASQASNADFEAEAKLMTKLRPHPNVCQILGMCVHEKKMLMIMEYCRRGSLFNYFGKNILTMPKKLKIIAGAAAGVRHLHKNSIVHRDLAARNILLTKDWEAKISDFGLSRIIGTEKKGTTASNVGPVRWMSPEALKTKEYSAATDVWSFGIVCYEIMAEQEPHPDMDILDAAIKIRDEKLVPEIPNDTPQFLSDLIKRCWSTDPSARPNFDEICTYLAEHVKSEDDESSEDKA